MATFRLMSYQVNGFRIRSGETKPSLAAGVISSQQPDLVLLQQIGSPIAAGSLQDFSAQIGLAPFGSGEEGTCAFLSRHPLHNIQEFSLGFGGHCIRADLDFKNERIHLFNLCLSFDPWQRRDQVRALLSEQLLNSNCLACATIVGGDFTLPLWGTGQIRIGEHLRRARFPLWRANYPSNFPLWGRDRIYFRGPIRALAGTVLATAEARQASPHLPLVLTVETRDTRNFLPVKERVGLRKPNPACG